MRHAHLLAVLFGVVCALGASSARAQDTMPHADAPPPPNLDIVKQGDLSAIGRIDEEHPERSIMSPEEAMKNPLEMGYLMMDLIARGEAATQRGDHEAAVRYYAAIAKAVPERAVAFSKMCHSYKALGNLEKAVENCKLAMGKGGVTLEDYAFYTRMLLTREQPLEPGEVDELEAIFLHLDQELGMEKGAKALTANLRCELATRLEDEGRLTSCVETLARVAPKDPRTFTFRWALAMKQREFDQAAKVVREAKAAGLPATALKEMAVKVNEERAKPPAWLAYAMDWRTLATVGLAAVMALVVVFAGRRRGLGASA